MPTLPILDYEEMYRVLAESATDAIITIDEHSIICSVNPAAERLFGYTAAELLGAPIASVIPERLRASHYGGVARFLTTNTRHFLWTGVRMPVCTRDGTERTVEISFGEFTSGGRPMFSGFLRDVTDRLAVENALRDSEYRLQHVLLATNDVVYDCDLASGTIYFSNALRTALGHLGSQAHWPVAWRDERIHPEDRAGLAAARDGAIAARRDVWSEEYRFERADGAYARVLDRGGVVRDADGRPARLIGCLTDVTERRMLEHQLRESQKMEAIGRLAGGVAHDFNNLLTAILGYAELARRDASLAPGVCADLDEISKAATRAARLTQQLLTFARRDPRQRCVRLDVNTVLGDSEPLLRQLLREHTQLLIQRAPTPAIVEIDPSQLEQVLLNLVVNARDAMPGGGTVCIEATTTTRAQDASTPVRDYVVLTISDTGSGIAAADVSRIFEPFFTTKGEAGTGLGLSIVYGVLQRHDGFIEVDSAAGVGTRFLVHLPRQAGDATPADLPAQLPTARAAASVLLVEDEAVVRQLIRRLLVSAGHRVFDARHGADGLLVWRAHAAEIDVVVTDLVMPEMGGRALVEHLRRDRPNLPVIYVSGYSHDDVANRGLDDPGATLLPKPFAPEALLDAIHDAVSRAGGG